MRRSLRPLLVNLDILLEMVERVEAAPARRADDAALRAAIREARPALAKLRAAVERMEGVADERTGPPQGGEWPADGPGL